MATFKVVMDFFMLLRSSESESNCHPPRPLSDKRCQLNRSMQHLIIS